MSAVMMIDSPLSLQITPVPAARWVLVGLLAVCVFFGLFSASFFIAGLFLIGIALLFFNDPPRVVPKGTGLTLAPLDGRLVKTTMHTGLPLAFDQARDQTEHFIRIDLIHSFIGPRTLRAPVTGQIREILTDGVLRTDVDEKPWATMDSTALLIMGEDGRECALVLESPLFPKQIHLIVRTGQSVRAGERLGTCLFFARASLYVDESAPLLRVAGHSVCAGETVLQATSFQGTPLFDSV